MPAAHVPPPPGVTSPAMWGTETYLRTLFGTGISVLRAQTRESTFRCRSPQHFLEFMRTSYGPMLKAFEVLDDAGREAAGDMLALMTEANTATGTLAVPSEYLEVVATRSS